MERISIFNYEAFYLDFLEGNLNEEDTRVLMNFLDENPSLKMEDEELPLFDSENITLDDAVKSDLKQPLLTDNICLNNIDFFLISDLEGLLPEAKLKELTAFISGNERLLYDKGVYASTKFDADLSIVYADKAGLKRRKAIIFWPYASVASAAAIIIFFMAWNSINRPIIDVTDTNGVHAKSNNSGTKINQIDPKGSKEITPVVNTDNDSFIDNGENDFVADNNINPEKTVLKKKGPVNSSVDPINYRSASPVLTALHNSELEPITKKAFANNNQPQETMDKNKALARYANMSNPIEPVTSFIESKTKTPVDFRTTEKVEGKRRGFFIKIGKFEISRNRH